MFRAAGEGSLTTIWNIGYCLCAGSADDSRSLLHGSSKEKGLPQHVPRHADVRPASSVLGVVAAYAPARQRGER